MNDLQKFIATLECGFLKDTDMPELIRLDPEFPVLVRCGTRRFVCPAQSCAERIKEVWAGEDYVRDVSIPVGSDARAAAWQPPSDEAAGCLLEDLSQPERKDSMTKEIKSPATEAFGSLVMLLRRVTPDGQQKITAHLKHITGRTITLPVFHEDKSIPDSVKTALYREIGLAIMTNNYSKLEVPAPEKRVDPLGPVIDVTPALPPSRPVAALEAPAAAVSPRNQGEAPSGQADSLSAAIAAAIQPLLKGGKAEFDEAKASELVAKALADYDAGFKDRLKEALGNGSFPTDRVKEIVKEMAPELGGSRIEFVTPEGTTGKVDGLMHPQVPQIAAWLRAGVPVWAWGAAGSGKTHMARQIAALLGIEAHVVSVDPTMTVSKIMGYRNVANGEFVEGFAYKPYKTGCLLAMDEKDTGDAGVMAAANAMLSNGHYLFPNGETVERNPKFHYLALANTKGMGATAGYVARNRLDAATLDRFAVIEIRYDAGLETALAYGEGKPGEPWKPGKPATIATQKAFVEWVQKVRQFVGNSVLISPRASINGCKALRCGIPLAEVVEALVLKLVADDSKQRIKDSCGLPKEAA